MSTRPKGIHVGPTVVLDGWLGNKSSGSMLAIAEMNMFVIFPGWFYREFIPTGHMFSFFPGRGNLNLHCY